MENWLVTAASRYPFVKTVLWYWIGATEFGVSIFWIVGLGWVGFGFMHWLCRQKRETAQKY